jgi:hypothetical protein
MADEQDREPTPQEAQRDGQSAISQEQRARAAFHANHGVGFEAYGYARLPFSSSVSELVKLPDALLNGRSSDCVANADHGSN